MLPADLPRRATLEPASAAYRSRARRPLSVIDDEDGTRLVLRVMSESP
jgi:hypothetical protein